ncbi:MAG: nucleotide exchange factor GrpE [Myxococcaceae bacterium]
MVNLWLVRINDRRRFHPDGAPREPSPEAQEAAATPTAPMEPTAGPEARELGQLKDELAVARARVNELAAGLQASVRDREAFKERLARENERLREVERAESARLVFEAIDALDLSLRAADASPLARGVRLIRDDLVAKLAGQGIERLELTGAQFDPNQAEAMDTEVVTEPEADGKVLSEVRAGYTLKGRVVRPAQVRVGRYVPPARA